MSYDWQDRLTKKMLPDGTSLANCYRGSETASSSLQGETSSVWNLTAETLQRNAYGRPERLTISGTDVVETFTHDWKYDSQGFPIMHSMRTESKALVNEQYDYNDMDKIERKHELVSGDVTNYTYAGKRISSSQSSLGVSNTYTYDAAGNLTQNRGCALNYTPGRVMGTKGSTTVFDVAYDNAGRMTTRLTDKSALALSYDSLGSLESIEDSKNNLTSKFVNDFEGDMLQRKHSDGSSDLLISPEYSIHVQPDGSRIVRYNLMMPSDANEVGHIVATICRKLDPKTPAEEIRNVKVHFCDTKGSVTCVLDGADASLLQKLTYDDFGLLDDGTAKNLGDDGSATYEGKYFDSISDLLDFGARWDDPLVGRFTTPDDILDMSLLVRTDGLNRYAFENNDPINHTDPTGHWSWSGVLGVVVSAGLIVAAVAVTVATGGAAAPLAAAAVGALASGGIAGVVYSVKHKDEENAGKFWGGFATTVILNASIGAATAGLGAAAGGVSFASAGARILARAAVGAALGGSSSVLAKAVERGVENQFYGAHHDLWEGAAKNFATGALVGGILGGASGFKGSGASSSSSSPNKLLGINKFEGSFKLRNFTGIRQVLAPQPTNPWAGLTKEILKTGSMAALKPTGKLAWRGVQENGWDKALINSVKAKF